VVGCIAPRPELDDALSVISSPTAILAADVAGYSRLMGEGDRSRGAPRKVSVAPPPRADVWFAQDSPLEQAGFELPVPPTTVSL
jgi:hypothetical protein